MGIVALRSFKIKETHCLECRKKLPAENKKKWIFQDFVCSFKCYDSFHDKAWKAEMKAMENRKTCDKCGHVL